MIPLEQIAPYASASPRRTAVADGIRSLSWQQFQAEVTSARNWFATALDPTARNRAVAFAGNTVDLVVATAALSSLGVPWVGIDPTRDEVTVRAQIEAVRPTVVMLDSRLANAAPAARTARWAGALVLDLATPDTGHSGAAEAWIRPEFLALGFTSGSTGPPKLFVRRSRTENQRLAYLRDHFAFGEQDVYLVTSPLAHASGHVWANAALSLGASVILGGTDPDQILALVERHRVTAAFLVPPALDDLLTAAIAGTQADLSSLRAVLTGGRQVSPRTIRQARQRLGPVLHLYYATTETGINTIACPADLDRDPYTAGFPMPRVRLRVVDPVTYADLPAHTVGLVAISSPLNMDGYPNGDAELVTRDGRSHVLTSDYGHLGADGQLFLTGRSDSLSGDGTLDVVRLEGELKELPGLQDVCVVRQQADRAVEVVAVAVLVEHGDRAAVHRRLGELLAEGQPYRVLALPQIPYNTAGKVDLRALRVLLGCHPVAA